MAGPIPRVPSAALACAFVLASTCVPARAQGGSLTTLFQASAGVQNGGNLFDLEVLRPEGLSITGFDVNLGGMAPPASFTLDVYVTPQGYWGKDTRPELWTHVASAVAQPLQPDVPVRVDTQDFFLARGSHGIALYVSGNGPWYTLPGGAPLSTQNADLALRFGISKPLFFAGGSFGPRVWNGTVYYGDAPPPIVTYGSAKPTSLGAGCIPRLTATGVLSTDLGSSCRVIAWRVPSHQPGLLIYGLNGRADLPFAGGRLNIAPPLRRAVPADSGGFAPGFHCWGKFELDLAAFARGELGGNPRPELRTPGTTVQCQWWGKDPGFASPFDAVLTEGLEVQVQ